MRITKFTHACVRIETGDRSIVVDPGSWTEPESVDGATAVLVTHEHPDHLSMDNLRRTEAPVYTIDAVAKQIREQAPEVAERVTVVSPDDQIDVGVPVKVVGEQHAVIHPDWPRFFNSGYLLEVEGRRIYHPGDALTPPPERADLLLVPVHAPWSKASEVMDFCRTVGAPRSVAVHDALLSERGLGLLQGMISGMLEDSDQEYVRVAPGEEISLRG